MAEHHGAEHHFFVQFLRLRLDHQHGVGGAGDDEVELALGHLVERRVEHVFVVDEADAGAADRAHERRAGERQRRGDRHHRQHDCAMTERLGAAMPTIAFAMSRARRIVAASLMWKPSVRSAAKIASESARPLRIVRSGRRGARSRAAAPPTAAT